MIDVPGELTTALDAFARTLNESGYPGWARRMERGRSKIAAGDAQGLDIVLNAYGGAGSLNDLPFTDDHPVKVLSAEVRERCTAVRTRLHQSERAGT
ncbi:DUF6966 domain-containing protein [Streptomyces sp. BE303]|uniref:DUF6966 domain-containing protein n=1 Tax=Streptomyces sp. BE303 TaxID=3002528 RepID=UPI002E75A217|nr:hypothetical protein [Streptomyces sp. BE303]MED7949668.1 hypothetical protein [Streptomyces sp. BE303]